MHCPRRTCRDDAVRLQYRRNTASYPADFPLAPAGHSPSEATHVASLQAMPVICSQFFMLLLYLNDLQLGAADHSQYIKGIAAQPEHLETLLKVHTTKLMCEEFSMHAAGVVPCILTCALTFCWGLQVLQAQNHEVVSPSDRSNLHPLVIPLAAHQPSQGQSEPVYTCLLRQVTLSSANEQVCGVSSHAFTPGYIQDFRN